MHPRRSLTSDETEAFDFLDAMRQREIVTGPIVAFSILCDDMLEEYKAKASPSQNNRVHRHLLDFCEIVGINKGARDIRAGMSRAGWEEVKQLYQASSNSIDQASLQMGDRGSTH